MSSAIASPLDTLPAIPVRSSPTAQEFEAIVAAEEPVIVKNVLESWPALAAGRESAATMTAYLKTLDIGAPAQVLEAKSSSEGWFFYQPDLRDFNFSHRERRVSEALDHIQRPEHDPRAPFIAIQSLPLSTHMPEFIRQNPAPLLPSRVMPRIWIGGAVKTPDAP
jgi:hypothetical protein